MRINQIWNELEEDKSLSRGLLLRRYSATTLSDVFVAFQQPENIRCIALRIQSGKKINLLHYSNLKDIRITVTSDDRDSTRELLLIALLNKQHNEVFATLAEDLINQIANVNEDILIKVVLNRFEMWKALFDKVASEGLSREEQQGLYGELYFLRKCILRTDDLLKPVQSWLGTERELRDFQSDGWGIEVKTTIGNNHQKIFISSERQLDTRNLNNLLLFHLSLEAQKNHGETLNQIVNTIVELLSSDVVAQIQFQAKLLQGGYFSDHASIYDITGYQIRGESFYSVRDNFPRIEETEIRRGVGDVKYSIILSEQSDYLIKEDFVFEIIN